MEKKDTAASLPATQRWNLKGRLGDVGLAVAVLAVVVMMVTPLQPWTLDLLIGANIALALLILFMALFLKSPLSFTAFPTVLLVATLYRLALNISSTRLILLRADAGRIIGGFGGVAVGGDILVGAVIFAILAMVLFLVITRGAERVAEVAARFTLDALPGMQLAIDADLRAGALSPTEASRRRAELERQSHYYGSLDGAMKFVRGDAIVGLVIIAVNIIGGLGIGMLRHGLSAGQALDIYGRLTIGDGLVTLMPALLVSTAAGLLVTRVGQSDGTVRLGEQIRRQIVAEPRALGAAAALLLVLAVMPGLPMWPFVSLGGLFGIAAVLSHAAAKRRELAREGYATPSETDTAGSALTAIELAGELYDTLTPLAKQRGGWSAIGQRLAAELRETMGLPFAVIPWLDEGDALERRTVQLRVKGARLDRLAVPQDALLCRADSAQLDRAGMTPVAGAVPGMVWIAEGDGAAARAAGLEVFDRLSGLEAIARMWLLRRPKQLIGVDDVQRLIDEVAQSRPALVRETVPKMIGLPRLTELLGVLAGERLSLDHLGEVLEALSREEPNSAIDDLVMRIRQRLAPVITASLPMKGANIAVLTLDEDVASVLKNSLSRTAGGERLILPPRMLDQFVQACAKAVGGRSDAVLLVEAPLRRPLYGMLGAELPQLRVIATDEIEPAARVEIAGKVTL